MGGIVACIRGCFAAAHGKVMLQCDWSAIEPRIGAWVVGDDFMLDAFRKIDAEGGFDIYQIEAARFYGCSPAEITGDRRQMGKVFVLQNQYESGEKSIQRAAKEQYGLALDIDTCIQAKDVWRVTHPKWVQMWRSLNDGALSALRNQGRVFRVGKAAFVFNGRDLRFRLPCGRVITYADASIKQAAAPWGEMRDAVHCYTLLHGHWVEDTIHGGAFFNALVQGLGASLMRHATRNLTAAGFDIIMRIHDEILVEADSPEQFAQFKKIMLTPPPWALDLPINGAGWIGPRFKKD
jgi:DNA polymerase